MVVVLDLFKILLKIAKNLPYNQNLMFAENVEILLKLKNSLNPIIQVFGMLMKYRKIKKLKKTKKEVIKFS